MWIAHWKRVRAQQSFAMSAKTLDPEYWIHRTRAWQKKTKNIESNELNLKHYNFCSRFLLSGGNLRLLWTPSPSFKWRFFSSWKKNGGLDIEASMTLHIAVVARIWPQSTSGRRRQTQNPSRHPSCSLFAMSLPTIGLTRSNYLREQQARGERESNTLQISLRIPRISSFRWAFKGMCFTACFITCFTTSFKTFLSRSPSQMAAETILPGAWRTWRASLLGEYYMWTKYNE